MFARNTAPTLARRANGENNRKHNQMKKSPLWEIRYRSGYYILANMKTGRTINTGYDVADVSEDYVANIFKKALSKLAR